MSIKIVQSQSLIATLAQCAANVVSEVRDSYQGPDPDGFQEYLSAQLEVFADSWYFDHGQPPLTIATKGRLSGYLNDLAVGHFELWVEQFEDCSNQTN
jgi:hypothetical protein